MKKELQIRNSTVEFLTFVLDGKEDGVQVLYKDETIWATQKAMAVLFEVGVPAISKHLKNIFDEGELAEIREIRLSERRFYQKLTDILSYILLAIRNSLRLM